jgi:hypothetical protein
MHEQPWLLSASKAIRWNDRRRQEGAFRPKPLGRRIVALLIGENAQFEGKVLGVENNLGAKAPGLAG